MTRDELKSFLSLQVWKLHNTGFQNILYGNDPNPAVQREGVEWGWNQKEFDVEKQCQERFGLDWATVRKHMYEAVQKVEILPGMMMPPDRAAKGLVLGGGTSNWMLNAFCAVLYLYFYSPAQFTTFKFSEDEKGELQGKQYTPENADLLFINGRIKTLLEHTDSELKEALKNTGSMFEELAWELLRMSIYLCPEDVKEVLKSHSDVLPPRKE